jgi:hypothetical protein
MSTHNDSHTGLIVAGIGGVAVLLWLLWRGRGKGNGKGSDGDHDSDSTAAAERRTPRAPVEVWIRSGDKIELDGASSDLATTVTRARATGTVNLHATGDARHGWVETVSHALEAAGVKVAYAPPPT